MIQIVAAIRRISTRRCTASRSTSSRIVASTEVGDINAAELIREAEMVEGWPCASLEFLLDWKDEVGRAKDTRDIEVLRKHLERKNRHGN
jgi:hypothetical protein